MADHHHGHGHDHHHGHSHDHGHSHAPADFGRAFLIGTILNIGIVGLQAVYGVLAHSTALLADAGHNLSDVLSLIVAWGAASLARRSASARYTYGLKGSSILAALFNATFLLVVLGGLGWEAIRRFSQPESVDAMTVMVVAGIGIAGNGITAWLFARGREGDINIRGVYLHMLTDAAISLGVVVAGALVFLTGAQWIDPAVTLVIVAVIVYGTWDLLKDSVSMVLAAVPPGIRLEEVRSFLSGLPGVASLHDLHIWAMSTTETALTCHLVMPGGHPGDGFTANVCSELSHRFGIQHTTVQIETSEQVDCALADAHAA